MLLPFSQKAPVLVGIEHRRDIVPFAEEEVRFEIDMCIGCDRCMRACPIPMSSTVNIADLNHATISDEILPHVARFTEECVMCGSCVPVCPVDNHRDLLMLSLKQRLGVTWDGNVDMRRVLNYLPSGWDVSLLLGRLREQPMFKDPQLVPDNYLLHMVTTSKMLTLQPGVTVLREGEYGRTLYIILEGRFELSSTGPDGARWPVAVLRQGEFMGERGMLTGQQRNATAITQTAAVVLEVPEQVIQRLMEIVPAVRGFFEQLNNARSAWQRFSAFFTKGAGKEHGRKTLPMAQAVVASSPLDTHQQTGAFGEMRKKLAIKCDLCAGYNNQACVQACPTGAAIRVQPVAFFGSTEEILSRRAQ